MGAKLVEDGCFGRIEQLHSLDVHKGYFSVMQGQ